MVAHFRGLPMNRAVSRRDVMRITCAGAVGLTASLTLHQNRFAAAQDAMINLRSLAESKNLLFGSSTMMRELDSNPEYAALLVQQCNIILSAGEFQWSRIQPKPGQNHDFSAPERLYEFATLHGMSVRGHALLYHQMTPKWLDASLPNPRETIDNHVRTKAAYFKGRIHSWDVVNEAIDHNSPRADGLRENIFLQLYGDDYIERAFQIAAEEDPHSLRLLSDYKWEQSGPEATKKRQLTLDYLNKLIRKKIPIQSIGVQGHVGPGFDAKAFDRFLKDCASLGLKIIVTEHDVGDKDMPANIAKRDAEVAEISKEFLSVALAHKETIAVICWGLSDRYTWLSGFAPRPDGLPVRPLPYDADLNPKPMVKAIADAIKHAPVRI